MITITLPEAELRSLYTLLYAYVFGNDPIHTVGRTMGLPECDGDYHPAVIEVVDSLMKAMRK